LPGAVQHHGADDRPGPDRCLLPLLHLLLGRDPDRSAQHPLRGDAAGGDPEPAARRGECRDQRRRLLHLPLLDPADDRGRAPADAPAPPMNAAPHLSVERVRKLYGEVAALDEVSLSVAAHDYVVLLGPSGSGKTTLLSVIGGFAFPTSGRVVIAGRDVTGLGPATRPTTTVFQDYALFPHMSVERNIGFGLKLRGVAGPERRERVGRALEMVRLAGFGGRGVHELSGGQRQRVALARALIV